jgi:PAP2 superfamily
MWLPWDLALWFAAVLGAIGVTLRPRGRRVLEVALPVAREAAVVLVMYAVWRALGEVTIMGTERAMSRGRWVWHAERWLHLPNELTLQRWTLHATWLARFANGYYIVAHVAPLGIFLVWLFSRHRDQYARWRNLLGFTSIVCLLIQLVPVAPPRLYPDLHFVDTAAVYGPRVYDSVGTNLPGQLSAMPSMHVAWAVLIGIACYQVSTSRWRWLGPVHAFLTVFAVTVTAYHWLLDGIVAVAILLIGMTVAHAWPLARRRLGRLPLNAQEREPASAAAAR